MWLDLRLWFQQLAIHPTNRLYARQWRATTPSTKLPSRLLPPRTAIRKIAENEAKAAEKKAKVENQGGK